MMFLDEDSHLADVQEALHGTDSKWMAIGIQLRIPLAKLNKIERQYQNLEDRNRQMQITWLKTGKATWKDLVAAMRTKSVGLPEEANSIEKTHILTHDDDGTIKCHTDPIEVEVLPESPSKSERLGEILEWLLKMGFTIEGISLWVSDKRKSLPSTFEDQAATNQSRVPTKNSKAQPQPRKRSNASQTKLPRAKRSKSEGVRTSAAAKQPVHRSSSDGGTKRIKMKNMLENMMKILEELEKMDAAEEFIDLVEKERAKDYEDIIKNPMYLTKMKQKVKKGDYDRPGMFCDDFNLIIKNCEEYNGTDHEFMKQANELEAKFKELCGTYLPDSDSDYSDFSPLENIPSDAESSDESERSARDSNSEQGGELDQSLSTVTGEEEDDDWIDRDDSD